MREKVKMLQNWSVTKGKQDEKGIKPRRKCLPMYFSLNQLQFLAALSLNNW